MIYEAVRCAGCRQYTDTIRISRASGLCHRCEAEAARAEEEQANEVADMYLARYLELLGTIRAAIRSGGQPADRWRYLIDNLPDGAKRELLSSLMEKE